MIADQSLLPSATACCGAPAPRSSSSLLGDLRRIASLKRPRWLSAPVLGWLVIMLVLALVKPAQAGASLAFSADAAGHIAPFFLFSIAAAAYIRASGADSVVSRVFRGSQTRMIMAAALFGAFSPFCSCGVIPIVAALLMAGVPLAPVMTFWLASPAMDPELFFLIAGSLGVEFAFVKTLAVLVISVAAGFATAGIARLGLLDQVLRVDRRSSCCAGPAAQPAVQWRVWQEKDRRAEFGAEFLSQGLMLGRWLLLAFLLESLMVAYLPASTVAAWLGAGNAWSIPLAALLGVPAYLNSYASIPLVRGLIDLGMSPAVALTFMLAGTMTSLPAAMAVWATVKPRAFAIYMAAATLGALGAGLVYAAIL